VSPAKLEPLPEPKGRTEQREEDLFPRERITKGEVYDYYRAVSPWRCRT